MNDEIDLDNPARTAEAILSMAQTWRYGDAGGAIVCDCPPGCTESDGSTHRFYGGHPVCESMPEALADFIIRAARVYDRPIQIRFDGPPSPTAGRFIEVEDSAGRSISIGEWVADRDDLGLNGDWLLKIPGVRR